MTRICSYPATQREMSQYCAPIQLRQSWAPSAKCSPVLRPPIRTIHGILHMRQPAQPLTFEIGTTWSAENMQAVLYAVFEDRSALHLLSDSTYQAIVIQLPNYDLVFLDQESHCLPGCGTSGYITLGISSQVRPSRTLPVRFLKVPPHCLKKKATSLSKQLSRISRTQSESIARAPGPDSPPTITQSIPSS